MRGRGRVVGVGEGAVWKSVGWEKVTEHLRTQAGANSPDTLIYLHTQKHIQHAAVESPQNGVCPVGVRVPGSHLRGWRYWGQLRWHLLQWNHRGGFASLWVLPCVWVCMCVVSAGALRELLVTMMATWVRFEGALKTLVFGFTNPAQNNSDVSYHGNKLHQTNLLGLLHLIHISLFLEEVVDVKEQTLC